MGNARRRLERIAKALRPPDVHLSNFPVGKDPEEVRAEYSEMFEEDINDLARRAQEVEGMLPSELDQKSLIALYATYPKGEAPPECEAAVEGYLADVFSRHGYCAATMRDYEREVVFEARARYLAALDDA